tara:strand:- start:441 stop:719 length:279 start_codon:yes stop_codon:yes gene_type:complete
MNYYIVNKIELTEGVVIYTPVGYVTSQEDVDAMESISFSFSEWINTNYEALTNGTVVLSDHFDVHGPSFTVGTITNYLPDGLSEITNNNQLI